MSGEIIGFSSRIKRFIEPGKDVAGCRLGKAYSSVSFAQTCRKKKKGEQWFSCYNKMLLCRCAASCLHKAAA